MRRELRRRVDIEDASISRRRALATIGGTVVTGLAGCSGDGDGTGDGTSATTGPERSTDEPAEPTPSTAERTPSTATEMATGTSAGKRPASGSGIEPMCHVVNDVDEFTVVGCRSERRGDQLVITATIRNDGDRTADFFNYSVSPTLYDSKKPGFDSRLSSSTNVQGPDDTDVPPGETIAYTFIAITYKDGESVDDVESYAIEVYCNTPSSGVYCG